MSTNERAIPPEHIWLPVWDLSSAIQCLEFLFEYISQYDGIDKYYQDSDTV